MCTSVLGKVRKESQEEKGKLGRKLWWWPGCFHAFTGVNCGRGVVQGQHQDERKYVSAELSGS